MTWTLWATFFILFQTSDLVLAKPNLACTFKDVNSIAIGPDRDQKVSGYCYGFAATAILQERYCRDKTPPCQFSADHNDQLSVADAIVTGNHGRMINGGYSNEILLALQRRKSIASETCAPLDPILSHSKIVKSSTQTAEWLESIRTAADKVQSPEGRSCAEKIAGDLKRQLGLATDVQQIAQGLRIGNRGIMLAEVIVPDSCAGSAIKLPEFNTRVFQRGDLSQTQEKMNQVLNEHKPVVVNLCAYSSTDFDRLEKNGSHDSCGAHALVVRGTRQVCCGDQCRTQYQVFDSAHIFKGRGLEDDNWLDQDKLMKQVGLKHRYEQTSTNPSPSAVDLTWLD